MLLLNIVLNLLPWEMLRSEAKLHLKFFLSLNLKQFSFATHVKYLFLSNVREDFCTSSLLTLLYQEKSTTYFKKG